MLRKLIQSTATESAASVSNVDDMISKLSSLINIGRLLLLRSSFSLSLDSRSFSWFSSELEGESDSSAGGVSALPSILFNVASFCKESNEGTLCYSPVHHKLLVYSSHR